MVVRRGCPDTHEFLGADFDHRYARIIVEVGDNVFRHGNSCVSRWSSSEISDGTIARQLGDA